MVGGACLYWRALEGSIEAVSVHSPTGDYTTIRGVGACVVPSISAVSSFLAGLSELVHVSPVFGAA